VAPRRRNLYCYTRLQNQAIDAVAHGGI
jgi:hypothetical protein